MARRAGRGPSWRRARDRRGRVRSRRTAKPAARGAGSASHGRAIATASSVGINTTDLDDPDLVGVGNSFQGLYVSNGMIIFDNTLTGNHYIGTNFSGLIAGPANIAGVLTIDGEYVVV